MKKNLLIIPILFIICSSLLGLISCAPDEALLPIDSTFVGKLPVEVISYQNTEVNSYIANRYLKITGEENRMMFLTDSLGLMKLTPVYIPEGDDFEPGKYNFGWPVAAMDGSDIIVSTQRALIPGQLDDKSGKGQLMIISKDGGLSWDKPEEVQNLQPYGYTVGSHSCIGTFNGSFIQKGNGILITDNGGDKWNPYPRAFKFATQEDYGITSPGIYNHPQFGLIFFTGNTKSIALGSVFRSDDGITWEDSFWKVKNDAAYLCPSPSVLVLDDGSILMASSNEKNMVQYRYTYTAGDTYRDIRFSTETINVINTSTSEKDTPDLFYNPVSDKIEMLESNPTNLLLWSIDKNELLSGSTNWKKECILFTRNGVASMCPAGSVIDPVNNSQHIFLYIGGEYQDRNCIFMLSRNLDTGKLSGWVNNFRGTE